MASYYVLEGYTTPAGVDSRQKVKEYQRQLGVRADGIWGPETQAAYSASPLGKTGERWGLLHGGSYGTAAGSTFGSFYKDALSVIGVPSVRVDIPSRASVEKDAAASLRPATDMAIEERRDRAETNMAELDADAAARGMGASTYVTSMKGREMSESENDVAMLESGYAAALAERVANYMQYYANLAFQASVQNAQLRANAGNAAANLAGQWYNAYLAANSAKGSSGGSSGSKGGSADEGKYFSMTPDEYEEFVSGMSTSDLMQLFNSEDAYWADCRDELYGVLGRSRYNSLEDELNPMNRRATNIAGKRSKWTQEKY